MSSSTEIPQDRPSPHGDKDAAVNSAEQQPPMPHDLEVAQACLNLRQESSKNSSDQGRPPNDNDHDHRDNGPHQSPNQQDPRSGGMPMPMPMMHPTMPPIPGTEGRGGPGGREDDDGRPPPMGGMPPHMYGYMPHPHLMEYGPNNGGPPMPPPNGGPSYYQNMGSDNNGAPGPGGFYPHPYYHPHDAEGYHHMMNMGGDMHYGMPGGNDPNGGMMPHPGGHFYAPMMHPDSAGHYHMMNNYPHGGGGGGYMKRPHPDDVMPPYGNESKRMRAGEGRGEEEAAMRNTMMKHIEDNSQMMDSKKMSDKHKKGKRSTDMPRRPLSAYNFFFSEERERILSALPDPDEAGEKKEENSKTEGKDNANEEQDESIKKEEIPSTDQDKLTEEEMKEKVASRSKRLLALREQSISKRRPHRKTHGKIGFKELVKQIGERWRSLPASEKEYYTELAKTDLRRYKEQMSEYNTKNVGVMEKVNPGAI